MSVVKLKKGKEGINDKQKEEVAGMMNLDANDREKIVNDVKKYPNLLKEENDKDTLVNIVNGLQAVRR